MEWETDIQKAIGYLYHQAYLEANIFDDTYFGKIFMARLKAYYNEKGNDIKAFGSKKYLLWDTLLDIIQNEQPFYTLCYADDPLLWGDEAQTRSIYKAMLDYYEKNIETRQCHMKEYIKLYWKHTSEKEINEPVVIIYEVDLQEDRYATRCIDIYADNHTENIEDVTFGFVTETPVVTVAEINNGQYGEEFHACLLTNSEFEEIWHTKTYHGDLYWQKD